MNNLICDHGCFFSVTSQNIMCNVHYVGSSEFQSAVNSRVQ